MVSNRPRRDAEPTYPAHPLARVECPARVLIGWVAPGDAALWLTGRRQDIMPTPQQEQLAARARAVVAAREPGIDQDGLVQAAPPQLNAYLAQLQADDAAASLLSSGWRLSIVELARICAAQPMVHVDHAVERTADANPQDVTSLAGLSLPITGHTELPAHFDPAQKSWMFTSANPNLRVTQAQHAVVNGAPVFGFTIALVPSFIRVARYQSRYLLIDGYHRAHGFLRRSIQWVPALVADIPSFEALQLPANGMLPQDAYLGDRPPTLADYLNDEVSVEVRVPATQRTIVLPALEMMVG